MGGSRSRVGDILLKSQILDALQLRSALAHQERWGGRLTHAVVELGLADDGAIADALAKSLGIQRLALAGITKEPAAISRIPAAFASSRGLFPVALRDHGKAVLLAMADPTDLMVLDEAAAHARARIQAGVAGENEIARAIAKHYRGVDLPAEPARARAAVQRSQRASTEQPAVVDLDLGTPSGTREFEYSPESLSAAPTTGQLLEEMLAQSQGPDWSAADRERLASVAGNQAKSAQVVTALIELLVDKGYLTKVALEAWRRGEPLAGLGTRRPSR